MVSEETLEKVREAFYNVRRVLGLKRWDLDDKVVSPFPHESNSDRLTVSIVRDEGVADEHPTRPQKPHQAGRLNHRDGT